MCVCISKSLFAHPFDRTLMTKQADWLNRVCVWVVPDHSINEVMNVGANSFLLINNAPINVKYKIMKISRIGNTSHLDGRCIDLDEAKTHNITGVTLIVEFVNGQAMQNCFSTVSTAGFKPTNRSLYIGRSGNTYTCRAF